MLKPHLLKISHPSEQSFNLLNQECPYFATPWHYHPEYEIVLILESEGKKFIGSGISDFKPGDLTLIGSLLPHYYKNEPIYYESNDYNAHSIVIHFLEGFLSEHFWQLPETKNIKNLLERSKRGIQFGEKTVNKIKPLMQQLLEKNEMPRLLSLLEILHIMSNAEDCVYLTTSPIQLRNMSDTDRMKRVFGFVMDNFREEIKLEKVAQLAHMSDSAFSRYFKQRTRRTFSQFILEIRIDNACKLLQESNLSIAEISFESGFNNLSNFNRQFKSIKKITPLAYRAKYFEN